MKPQLPVTIGPIQKGVPIPPRSSSLYSALCRAVLEMPVGAYREIDGPHKCLCSSVLTIAKRVGMKVETRKLNGHGIGVWRTG